MRQGHESQLCFQPGRCAGCLRLAAPWPRRRPRCGSARGPGDGGGGEATPNLWKWLTRALDVQPKWLPHPKGTGGAQRCFLLVNFYLLACWPGWHMIVD